MARLLPTLFKADNDPLLPGPATDSLALCSAVVLHGIWIYSDENPPGDIGKGLVTLVLDCLANLTSEQRGALLDSESFVEMLWTLLLASGRLDQSSTVVVEGCDRILDWLGLDREIPSSYLRRFAAGVKVGAGQSADEVDEAIRKSLPPNPWHSFDEFHIPPLGRANACNRNQTQHRRVTIDSVEQWAISNFPDFGDT